ncbi:MAG: hypothetical protein EBU90_17255 [Proteobacteria bacterium]|nr:hypothetical protein [Pseudomonadota bacterium]NBP15544.1 hypothetical protein [bacterium]
MDQNTRVAVLETKVENINEDLKEIKKDIREVHDCVDRTRQELSSNIETHFKMSTEQHEELSAQIKSIKEWKNKWTWTIAGALAALGWASGHADILKKFF